MNKPHAWIPICVLLQLACLTSSALAIITSDDPANHRVVPGVPSYGLNLDGVAVIGSGDPDTTSIEDVVSPLSDRRIR